ncbi:MAG: hypothetical protein KBD83_09040 [Gammaproteobacteria bacterium]|nr:hypothetical protein [Gammaproteobacteria bacterium]
MKNTMLPPEKITGGQLRYALRGFTCTENWYSHPLTKRLVYTDGVRHLAQICESYWLIDLIALQFLPELIRTSSDWFYSVRINVSDHQTGVVIVTDENSKKPILTERLSYTTFPKVKDFMLFIESMDHENNTFCLLLPSEH